MKPKARIRSVRSRFETAARHAFACTSLAAALFGCGGGMTFIVQQYDGPPRAAERVAIIRVDAKHTPDVVAVDGQPLHVELEPGNRIHVEVLPSAHEVDVTVTDPTNGLRRLLSARFIAEAGKVYRADFPGVSWSSAQRDDTAPSLAIYEVDRETDRAVRVVPSRSSSTP